MSLLMFICLSRYVKTFYHNMLETKKQPKDKTKS